MKFGLKNGDKMKKVLLVNPFLTLYSDDPSGINPPLGLAYLAAFLEKKGVCVKILDVAAEGIEQKRKIGNKIRYGLAEKEIVKRIKEFGPEIVGITCQSTLHAKDAQQTAKIVKSVSKDILVVFGGAHPSAMPGEVLKNKNVDVVIRGEGEITLWEVVKKYPKSFEFDDILGISFRMGKKIIHNPPRPLIKDLDELPFPARHLLPMEIYFKKAEENGNYNMNDRVATLVTSRGCPGNCIYCAVRTVWGRVWRGRSPKNVVEEIEQIVKDYKVREFHFLDDSLAVDRQRLKGICEEIIKRKLDIKWATPNGIAVWMLDEDLLVKMEQSGCYRLTFGLESGNKEVLHNFIGKNYDYDKARAIIRFASKIGIWTVGTFIIGFPYETRQQIEDTIAFAISTDLDFAVFYIANPFPGTPMYEIYQRENLLPKSGAYEIVRGCQSKNFSHKELISFQQRAFSQFIKSRFFKPWLFWRKIKEVNNYSYLGKLSWRFGKLILSQFQVQTKGIAALWR